MKKGGAGSFKPYIILVFFLVIISVLLILKQLGPSIISITGLTTDSTTPVSFSASLSSGSFAVNEEISVSISPENAMYSLVLLDQDSNPSIIDNLTFAVSQPGSYILNVLLYTGTENERFDLPFTVSGESGEVSNGTDVVFTEFDNKETTNFSKMTEKQLEAVDDVVIAEPEAGVIEFKEDNLNLTGTNLDEAIEIKYNFIEVDVEEVPELNVSATLTIYNVPYDNPVVYMDGSPCPADICTNIIFDTENITFDVPHFTNFTTGPLGVDNTSLVIFDQVDSEGGNIVASTNEMVFFFANFTNISGGAGNPINNSTDAGECNISFNTVPIGPFNMTFNESTQFYKYNRTFAAAATVVWNVTCFSPESFRINVTDRINITPDNNITCADQTACEYQNITDVLDEENNTHNTITLYENNSLFQMPSLANYFNLTLNISADNITVDCNGTILTGLTDLNEIIIDTAPPRYNVTVKNCVLSNMNGGLSFKNVTLGRIENINASTISGAGIGVNTDSNNITVTNINLSNDTGGTARGLFIQQTSGFVNVTHIYITSSLRLNLDTASNGFYRYLTLRDDGYLLVETNSVNNSFFDVNVTNTTAGIDFNSGNNTLVRLNKTNSSDGVDIGSSYNTVKDSFFENMDNIVIDASGGFGALIENNTLINNRGEGIRTGDNSTITNNYLKNNSFGLGIVNVANVTITNNTFLNAYNTNILGAGIDAELLVLSGGKNITIANNYFNETTVTPIFLLGALGASRDINITNNTFRNVQATNFSITVYDAAVLDTRISGNMFLSRNVSDSGTGTLFCVNGEGNFYEESLGVNANDCGQVNITTNLSGQTVGTTPFFFNWTRQSSSPLFTVNYDIIAFNSLGESVRLLQTTDTSGNLNPLLMGNGNNTFIKVIPFVEGSKINGTTNSTENFTVSNSYSGAGISTGAGGGGGGRNIIQNTPLTLTTSPQEATISPFNTASFSFNGQTYSIKFKRADSGAADFSIGNQQLSISVNARKGIDLDGDGNNDILVGVSKILGVKTTIQIQQIKLYVPPKPYLEKEPEPIVEVAEEKEEKKPEPVIEIPQPLQKPSISWPLLYAVIIAVIVAMLVLHEVREKRLHRHVNMLQGYVDRAFHHGYSKDQIHMAAKLKGWSKKVVNRAIKNFEKKK